MYNLLIVDDESLVRNGIARMIDWNSLGFSKIYQAEDGVEALEIVRRSKVDLVLTDIVMPFMDGMELSEILSTEFPEIQVVVLTGHENFEYAKQSVDLGIKNYILKPVGAKTLYEKMKGICENLNMQSIEKEYIIEMKEEIRKSRPILRERFLKMLVCEGSSFSDGKERVEALELPLEEGPYLIAIVEPELTGVKKEEMELFSFAVKNITFDMIGNKRCMFEEKDQIILIFTVGDFEEGRYEIIYDTLQVIQKAVSSVLKIDVTCGIGSIVEKLSQLRASYQEAEKALECKHSLGENRIYNIKDLNYVEKSFYYPTEEMQALLQNVKFMPEQEIEKTIAQIKYLLTEEQKLPLLNIKMIYIEMVTMLLKEISSMKDIPHSVWEEGFALYRTVETMSSQKEVGKDLIVFATHVSQALHNLQNTSSNLMVERAKNYVDRYYNKEEISLSTAADFIAVSSGYLSALFKKETGTNFVKYLTEVRIEKAKSLLVTTDLKTYEIADRTGFANAHYFSVLFKKNTGFSPSDFRNIKGEK